jgi:protein SCO1/2
LLILLAVGHLYAAPTTHPLLGTVYTQAPPAADFTLTDQHGKPFHMADTRGKVVVLSFLYTHCTDYCPFMAVKLMRSARLLGPAMSGVVIVPVTTDPQRDTPQVLAEYSKTLGMLDSWHFLTGSLSSMRKVWKDYFIGVEAAEKNHGAPAAASNAEDANGVMRGLSATDKEELVGRIINKFGGGYEVSHDTPFWIVDKRGILRVSLGADATPADIAFDVRSLLAE